ncbi:putative holin-like toxin [Oceanobacillus damuensis]
MLQFSYFLIACLALIVTIIVLLNKKK